MAEFVDPGANTDADSLRELAVAAIQDGIPGLVLRPGHPIWLLLDQTAEMAAECAKTFNNAQQYRFRTEGAEIDGVTPIDATAATATTEWTLATPDPEGLTSRTVPGGSQIAIQGRVFLTSGDVTGAPGAVLPITAVAAVEGSDGSGLTGPVTLLEPYAWVASVALTGITTGGVDAETDDAYEPRLARNRRHAGRPILDPDFSAKALDIPGVDRALALDGYDAVAGTYDHEKTVTLAVVDEAGQAVSTGVKNAVQARIESEREINWAVYVIDPTYTTVSVAATVNMLPGYTSADVDARCVTAMEEFLDPATWGDTPTGEEPSWHDEPEVLMSEIYTALNNVDGVRHVTALTISRGRPVTGLASTNVITSTAHGFSDTDAIVFGNLNGGTGLTAGTTYFVRDSTANTFKVAATSGGTAIDFTTDIVSGRADRYQAANVTLAGPAPLPLPGTIAITVDE